MPPYKSISLGRQPGPIKPEPPCALSAPWVALCSAAVTAFITALVLLHRPAGTALVAPVHTPAVAAPASVVRAAPLTSARALPLTRLRDAAIRTRLSVTASGPLQVDSVPAAGALAEGRRGSGALLILGWGLLALGVLVGVRARQPSAPTPIPVAMAALSGSRLPATAAADPGTNTAALVWDLEAFSPSKINLFLRIIRRREDGYHDLASLFQVAHRVCLWQPHGVRSSGREDRPLPSRRSHVTTDWIRTVPVGHIVCGDGGYHCYHQGC